MNDMKTYKPMPTEGVIQRSSGQTNDGTTNVGGDGRRYGEPGIARTAAFDADRPHVVPKVDSAEILGVGTEPAITANAPGQKRSEAYGRQRP